MAGPLLAATNYGPTFPKHAPAPAHLKTRALAKQQKGFTAVMVVHEAGRVVGYYGLAPTAVVPSTMPRSVRTGPPLNPVPCLLGQLATDQAWAGRGVGTALLAHALQHCVTAAGLIGGRAVVVNALDEDAASWARRGFLPSKDDPLLLFRAIPDIAASLEAAGIALPALPLRRSQDDCEPLANRL